MRFKSALLGQASGSIGGMTASRNAGGQYFRIRATPTDPNTPAQATVRAAVASLVNHWVNTLTGDQRSAWNTYAGNVPLNDVFGDPRFRTGINQYVRSNVSRIQNAVARVDDGPTEFNLGEFSAPSFSIDVGTQELSVTFTDSDEWANEDGAYMILYVARPKAPTINFYKGPYTLMGGIVGNSGGPPASPALKALPYVYAAGQKGFARVIVSRADGRLATPFRDECVAA